MILSHQQHRPSLGQGVFIAATATVAGNVRLDDDVNIWFAAVLRGDVGAIHVGARTNIQDGAILHMTTGVSDVEIGSDVTIGHGAIIHGAHVSEHALIGMGATLLDRARVGAWAMVGAGALLPPGFEVPDGMLAVGSPAEIVRPLRPSERAQMEHGVQSYLALKVAYATNVAS